MEVDAIPAAEIRHWVEQAIVSHIDIDEWHALSVIEEQEKQLILEKLRLDQ